MFQKGAWDIRCNHRHQSFNGYTYSLLPLESCNDSFHSCKITLFDDNSLSFKEFIYDKWFKEDVFGI